MAELTDLTYMNEDDKAFGLAGMAVSLAALDAMDRVVGVSLDADGPMITFSHEYYFPTSPSLSAKASWTNMVQNYYITSAMVLSNVMARSLIRLQKDVPESIMTRIREEIAEEGRTSCDLEDDEIDDIYAKTHTYMRRIFRNPRLAPAIEDFAHTLSRRRSLSAREIMDELRALQIV